jgi:hypothetical protein
LPYRDTAFGDAGNGCLFICEPAHHAVLRQVTDAEPADIRRDNPDMPGWFAALVHRLLSKDPAARFQSAAEVAEILEGCLAHVNDPLVNPLPAEVAVPEPPHRLLPHDQIRNTRSSFLALLRRIMSDQRILAITALMLLLAAVLLPWPIAAVGRDEMALIFAVVAAGSSLHVRDDRQRGARKGEPGELAGVRSGK